MNAFGSHIDDADALRKVVHQRDAGLRRNLLRAASMKIPNVLRQAFHRITDWRRHEHLLRLSAEYTVPAFLMPDDLQLPPKPPARPAEVGKESPTPISRDVTPDMEIIIFSDGQQLKIPRSRKGR